MTITKGALLSDLLTDFAVYIDSVGGNDTTADGTFEKPFKTLAGAAAFTYSYKNASSILLLIKDGSTFNEHFELIKFSESASAIGISSYDNSGSLKADGSFSCLSFDTYRSYTRALAKLSIGVGITTTSNIPSENWSFRVDKISSFYTDSRSKITTNRFVLYQGVAEIGDITVGGFWNMGGTVFVRKGIINTDGAYKLLTSCGITILSNDVIVNIATDTSNNGQLIRGELALANMPDYTTIATPAEGRQAWNTSTHKPVWYNGTAWIYADDTEV